MQKELGVIMDLMEDLQEKMQYGDEDFAERLGRKKPDLEIAKISMGEEMPTDPDESPEMDDMEGGFEDEESPEDKLKNRILRMRG